MAYMGGNLIAVTGVIKPLILFLPSHVAELQNCAAIELFETWGYEKIRYSITQLM